MLKGVNTPGQFRQDCVENELNHPDSAFPQPSILLFLRYGLARFTAQEWRLNDAKPLLANDKRAGNEWETGSELRVSVRFRRAVRALRACVWLSARGCQNMPRYKMTPHPIWRVITNLH